MQRAGDLLIGDAPFALSTVVRGDSGLGRTVVLDAGEILAGSTGSDALDEEVARQSKTMLARGESKVQDVSSVGVFTEALIPPPYLVVFGSGDDALPLCTYASEAGFRVTMVDHRRALLSPERYPGAARLILRRPEEGTEGLPLSPRSFAVVKTHSCSSSSEP